jgi:hypothetical protein
LSSELADTWYALDFMMETLLGLIQCQSPSKIQMDGG